MRRLVAPGGALMGRLAVLIAIILVPVAGAAHTVQLAPSVCAFDPFTIEAPRRGLAAFVAPPDPLDRTRIFYTTGSSVIQFAAPASSARAFDLSGSAGTILLPTDFQATMTAAGNIATHALPLEVVVDGTPATLFVRFGTGLAGAADASGPIVVEGRPVAPDGTFMLIGLSSGGDGLPAGLRDLLIFRMTCRTEPAPDLDQFAPVAEVGKLTGNVGPSGAKLRFELRMPDAALPDFAASRAIVRVSVGDTTVAAALVPGGLVAAGRSRFAGVPFAVKLGRRRPTPSFVVTLDLPVVTLPPIAGGQAPVTVSVELGGLGARVTREFRVAGGGTQLRAR